MKARKSRTPAPTIAIRIEEPAWREDASVPRLIRRAARLALAMAEAPEGSLTILLAGDKALRALNAQFRSKNKATNVLSFPGSEDDAYLGDIAIAHGVVAREAKAQKKLFSAHAAHLTVHGVLHLLGYDHETDKDAAIMESLEILILEKLGVADPYRPRPYTKRRKTLH